jgi:hypothetical protein
MHEVGLVTGDIVWDPATAAEELVKFLRIDAGEDGWVGDLVTVQVEDGEDGAIGDGIEELVGVPGSGEGPGLGLAIADDAGDDEVGVVEGGAEGVTDGIAEFTALVDGAGAFGRDVAWDAAREGELEEEFLEAGFVLGDVGIDFGVGSFEVGIADGRRSAMTWAGDIDHVEIKFPDDAIEVDIDEVLAGGCAPVAEEHVFDVGEDERPPEEGIVGEIDLADGQVVGGPPIGIDAMEEFGREDGRRMEHGDGGEVQVS